uniref:YckD family protein n=1 Tax=Piscibacillus halophilus TaxID=571933 RepID=UPI00240A8536
AVLSMGVFGSVSAEPAVNEDVELTEEQKSEMAAMQKEVLEKEKEIIQKYVEYGVFSLEKGEKIIGHLDKHYEKLEENGFIPKWDKKHKRSHGDKDVDDENDEEDDNMDENEY